DSHGATRRQPVSESKSPDGPEILAGVLFDSPPDFRKPQWVGLVTAVLGSEPVRPQIFDETVAPETLPDVLPKTPQFQERVDERCVRPAAIVFCPIPVQEVSIFRRQGLRLRSDFPIPPIRVVIISVSKQAKRSIRVSIQDPISSRTSRLVGYAMAVNVGVDCGLARFERAQFVHLAEQLASFESALVGMLAVQPCRGQKYQVMNVHIFS